MNYNYGNVYGLKPLMRPPTLISAGGRSLTIPNQAVNIADAINRYSAPSILEKLKGYYEEEGLELPNFDRLDKVERLQLLADAKQGLFDAKAKAEQAIEDDAARAAAAEELKSASHYNPIPNASTPK